jgi:hypothetical protein
MTISLVGWFLTIPDSGYHLMMLFSNLIQIIWIFRHYNNDTCSGFSGIYWQSTVYFRNGKVFYKDLIRIYQQTRLHSSVDLLQKTLERWKPGGGVNFQRKEMIGNTWVAASDELNLPSTPPNIQILTLTNTTIGRPVQM